jgi:hypothetical protein
MVKIAKFIFEKEVKKMIENLIWFLSAKMEAIIVHQFSEV